MEDKKVAIKAELITGANARKLAEKYDVHYSTVVKYRNELRDGKKDAIDVVDADIEAPALHLIAEGVKAKSDLPPKVQKVFEAKVDDIVEGISSLQLLDTEFHKTITKLLDWANNQITDDMAMKDWRMIASQIGDLHTAIFSKGTTVNVQQNNNTGNSFTQGMVN